MPSQRAGKARAFAPTGITSSQGSVICPAGSCTALHYVRLWLGLCTLSVTSDKKISHLFFFNFLEGGQFGHEKSRWGSVAEGGSSKPKAFIPHAQARDSWERRCCWKGCDPTRLLLLTPQWPECQISSVPTLWHPSLEKSLLGVF